MATARADVARFDLIDVRPPVVVGRVIDPVAGWSGIRGLSATID
jgi:hypothetical protein